MNLLLQIRGLLDDWGGIELPELPPQYADVGEARMAELQVQGMSIRHAVSTLIAAASQAMSASELMSAIDDQMAQVVRFRSSVAGVSDRLRPVATDGGAPLDACHLSAQWLALTERIAHVAMVSFEAICANARARSLVAEMERGSRPDLR